MAAPKKRGLDYFPFDCDLLQDVKLRKPKLEYGYLAAMVYVALLAILYKDKGYYIDYSDQDNVIWLVLEDLQGPGQPAKEKIAEVIEALVACGLFDAGQFRAHRLTSKRVQTVYYSATLSRKTVAIDAEIWLLSLEEMQSLSGKHSYYLKLLQAENGFPGLLNQVNEPGYPQSKVKQSKVKQSKVKQSKLNQSKGKGAAPGSAGGVVAEAEIGLESDLKTAELKGDKLPGALGEKAGPQPQTAEREPTGPAEIAVCLELMEKIKGAALTRYESEKIGELWQRFGLVWLKEALQVMADAGKCKLNYAEGVLNNWRTEGKMAAGPGESGESLAAMAQRLMAARLEAEK